MKRLHTVLAVIGAATVLVLAANTVSLAATGNALILGKANSANTITEIKRTTAGSALKLTTKAGANAPFTTNGKGKVTNLNADRVDGLDAASLQTRSYAMTRAIPQGEPVSDIELPINLPNGNYLLSYNAYLLGGYATDGGAGCYLRQTEPGGESYLAETWSLTKGPANPAFTGTAVVKIATGYAISLYCFGAAPFWAPESEPIRVFATPVKVIPGGSLG